MRSIRGAERILFIDDEIPDFGELVFLNRRRFYLEGKAEREFRAATVQNPKIKQADKRDGNVLRGSYKLRFVRVAGYGAHNGEHDAGSSYDRGA